jgi:hypothetical protein
MGINERVEGEICLGLPAQLPEYGIIRQRWSLNSIHLSPTKATGRCMHVSTRLSHYRTNYVARDDTGLEDGARQKLD